MAVEFLFPESALTILRRINWDPNASCLYEGMSGGLVWGDEFPREAFSDSHREVIGAMRFVLGYRASLIRGQPREGLRSAWEQLARECPRWPGFRPERRAPELRDRLDAENDRFLRELNEQEEKYRSLAGTS
jgi:hypothetical protein